MHIWYRSWIRTFANCNTAQPKWEEILPLRNASADVMMPRYGHTLVETESDFLITFGGYNGSHFLNDIWRLDKRSEQKRWRKMDPFNTIPERSLHFAARVDHEIIVIGGRNDTAALSDVWSFRLGDNRWTKLRSVPHKIFDLDGGIISRNLGDKSIFILGGRNETTDFVHALRYDIVGDTWSVIESSGTVPAIKRSGHTTVFTPKDTVLVFGGYSLDKGTYPDQILEYDMERNTWTTLETKGRTPPGRYGHTANLIDNNKMVIFGGWDGERLLNDIWIYDVDKREWSQALIEGTKPEGRALHASYVDGTTLYIHGGNIDEDRATNDMWSINLEEIVRGQAN